MLDLVIRRLSRYVIRENVAALHWWEMLERHCKVCDARRDIPDILPKKREIYFILVRPVCEYRHSKNLANFASNIHKVL